MRRPILMLAAIAVSLVAYLAMGPGDPARATSGIPLFEPAPDLRNLELRLAQQQPDAAPAPAAAAQPGAPESPQQVKVGIYPMTVYELDVGNSTFEAAFYIWFRWTGDINPTETMELVNLVDSRVQENILKEPEKLPDGSLYQIVRVQGRFFQPFSLARYPLDTQMLNIDVEDSTYATSKLVYVPDTTDSGFSDRLQIPGWRIDSWKIDAGTHVYGTTFGEGGGTANSRYGTLTYSLKIERPVSYFMWKLLLPLCIVLAANWTVLLLHPRLIEVRTALPATALLTAVFLQQSYSASLPEIGYLVLLDKIYALAYAMILLTLAAVIATTARYVKAGEDSTPPRTYDRILLIMQVLVFAAGTAGLVLFR